MKFTNSFEKKNQVSPNKFATSNLSLSHTPPLIPTLSPIPLPTPSNFLSNFAMINFFKIHTILKIRPKPMENSP